MVMTKSLVYLVRVAFVIAVSIVNDFAIGFFVAFKNIKTIVVALFVVIGAL